MSLSMQEKDGLLPCSAPSSPERPAVVHGTRVIRRLAVFVGLTCAILTGSQLLGYTAPMKHCKDLLTPQPYSEKKELCAQYDVLTPKNPLWKTVGETIGTEAFKAKAVEWIAGAVRVPTESYDHMDPVGVDSRWEAFGPFHEYLLTAFPLVHSSLSLAKVNTYGLLYEWKGKDSSLKPVLLAAHQDVVPVDAKTVDEWTFPPYSGHFDGTRVWGRGSSDDKSGLIGLLSAIETMLENSFKPERTFVLAFGFDEEASGHYGASELGKAMLEIYGENAFAFIVDEGGGFSEQYGTIFAMPGIAEKGYLDVHVDVSSPGGHSSIPPSHTTIGILSRLLVEFEDHPYTVEMSTDSIFYGTLRCYAGHGKTMPSNLHKAIVRAAHSDKALKRLGDMLFEDKAVAALVGTTQAIDLIEGGVKANALPENAYAVLNHRISTLSSVQDVIDHDTETIKALADKFNLTFTSFGNVISNPDAPSAYGTLSLSDAFGNSLAPAPITPTSGSRAKPFEILSGTIQATYNAHRAIEGSNNIVVAPGMPTGNTDTRYYWNLSDGQIFRYNHRNSGTSKSVTAGVHTVNENIEIDTFLEMIRFFTTLILNADETRLV